MSDGLVNNLVVIGIAIVPVILYFGKIKQVIEHLSESVLELKAAIKNFAENDKNLALANQKISFLEERIASLEKDR